MWSNNLKVEVPKEMLKGMQIEGTTVSPSHPEVGVLILSKGFNQFSTEIVFRLYRIQKDPTTDSYYIVLELEAFMFKRFKEAKDFLEKLPNMTGLEMLLLLNPVHPVSNLQ
ncbi:hypothetical protein M3936_23495 [Sutcliffiella horikoshii]|uniref:hypothetical protein n=1 Tax=Sutcliffiella horikoshii TaxID=79883 RepID=UPI0007D0A999|nr:hypothetical protein [Sutcliffiella horikoshii]MCM3620523.1 hypothetical protein [Sutcliffiella horikoshii]